LAEMIPTEGETSNLKDCVLMAGSKLTYSSKLSRSQL
jgi:hypothetical protein